MLVRGGSGGGLSRRRGGGVSLRGLEIRVGSGERREARRRVSGG